MHHHIRAVFNGAQQVGRGKGGIHHQRYAVTVGDGGQRFHIRHVGIGVSQSLGKQQARFRPDGGLHGRRVANIHKCGRYARKRQRMSQQIVCAAVNGLGGNDMPASRRQRPEHISDSRCARSDRKRGCAALQRRYALLEHILRGVRQAAVDVSRVPQAEAVGCMGAAVEHIRGGLVDRHGAGVRGGVRVFLPRVELERFKMYVQTFKIRHGNSLLSVQARAARRGRVCGGHPPMHIRLFRQRHSRC